MTKPSSQGACGSCWAFTAVATLESLAAITGHDSQVQEYSVQQLVDCDRYNYGCDGGWMYDTYEYTSKNGVVLKSDYTEYSGKQG